MFFRRIRRTALSEFRDTRAEFIPETSCIWFPYISSGYKLSLGVFHFLYLKFKCQWFMLSFVLFTIYESCLLKTYFGLSKPNNEFPAFLMNQIHMWLNDFPISSNMHSPLSCSRPHKTPESFTFSPPYSKTITPILVFTTFCTSCNMPIKVSADNNNLLSSNLLAILIRPSEMVLLSIT